MNNTSIIKILLSMLLIVSLISNCRNTSDAYLVERGKTLNKSGNFQEAIENFNQAIENNPDLAEAYLQRGVAWHNMNQPQKALNDYSRAIEIKDDLTLAYFNRGQVWIRMKEYEKALPEYNKAIELKPDFPNAFNSRGLIHYHLGNYENAITDYKKAIDLNNFFAQAYNSLAWLLATCPESQYRNGDKAVTFSVKAVNLNPENPYFYDTLAASYAESGDFQRAVSSQEKAIKLLKKNDKYNLLKEFYRQLEFYRNAKPWREK